jgi:CheY-like chemotaxis protein
METASSQQTIMVVDDFDDTRLVIKTWLERKGYRVIEAADGLEAVRLARRASPDLIIMDIEMPKLDGLAATRQIRKDDGLREIPILAVSAYGEAQYRAMALEAGCTEYVSTPFDPEQLGTLINQPESARPL